MEDKQEMFKPGVDLNLEQRKDASELRERNNNTEEENRKIAHLNSKKKSLQEHEYPAKSQKTNIIFTICNKSIIKN